MDIDQIHPAGGFGEDPLKAQKERQSKEMEQIAMSLPVLEEVIQDFDTLIAQCDSIDQLTTTSEIKLTTQLLALKKLKQFALGEKAKFTAKYKNYQEATK